MGFLLDIAVYIALSSAVVYYYYYYKHRDLPGGFWGAVVISLIGAVLLNYVLNIRGWFPELVNWLMVPKITSNIRIGVNLIAAAIGSFLFIYILNKINHDKERR